MPRFSVRFGRIFQSSWAYHSKFRKCKSGTMSRLACEKEKAFPSRKFAKAGLPPESKNEKLPFVGFTAFSVLRIHCAVKPNRKVWRPLTHERLSYTFLSMFFSE